MLAFAFALGVSFPYLFGGWVWDDHLLFELERSGGLLSLWTEAIVPSASGPGAAYYRPVALTVMHALAAIGGPLAVHIGAGLLHASSTVLIWKLLSQVHPDRETSALPWATLFAAHPVAGEVLGWSSAFPDALATTLGLACVWAVQQGRIRTYAACALLALLSKETALVFVCLSPWLAPSNRRRAFLIGGCSIGVWATLRLAIAGVASSLQILYPRALLEAPFELASLLIWPWPLTATRDAWLLGPVHWLIGAATLAAGWAIARKTQRLPWMFAATALLLLATPVVAQSHFAADRYAYPAVACATLAIGSLALSHWGGRLLTAVCVLLYLGVHIPRSSDWRDDTALFSSAVHAQPASAFSWHLLGVVRLHHADYVNAAEAFTAALSLEHPLQEDAELRLVALVESGAYQQAAKWVNENPQEHATARYIAYAAKSFLESGNTKAAADNIAMLRQPDGTYDGPAWVANLARHLNARKDEPIIEGERPELPLDTP